MERGARKVNHRRVGSEPGGSGVLRRAFALPMCTGWADTRVGRESPARAPGPFSAAGGSQHPDRVHGEVLALVVQAGAGAQVEALFVHG